MRRSLFVCFVLFSTVGFAQDIKYAKSTLKKLTAEQFWGRGYTNNGMYKAADFIATEFKNLGLSPLDGKNYLQPFLMSVNTFPGKMQVKINGRKLNPGVDFIVNQASVGKTVSANLVQEDSVTFVAASSRIVVSLQEKLTWSVSQKVADYTEIILKKEDYIKNPPNQVEVDIENVFVDDFRAHNVGAIVKGTSKPDSVILITAHYDHLGGMGKETYFPGANDNASGVSFLLSLAKYYAHNPQKYSIAFICFGAEEAGILGSKYFIENPQIPLTNIRFMFNVDMVGTGETGATVVNATLHKKEFEWLNQINDAEKLLVKINPRGKAANSDHYFFTEKGVPAFFLYTQGGITAYHDVFDKAETLPFTVYENLFKLFVGFNKQLMN